MFIFIYLNQKTSKCLNANADISNSVWVLSAQIKYGKDIFRFGPYSSFITSATLQRL